MFIFKKFKRVRVKTEYIILVPSVMLKEKFFIDPIIEDSGRLYTWGIWEEYFLKDLQKESLPCHYFMEYVDRDYVCYKGLPEFQPSYFIEDLVSAGIVDFKYRKSIIVVLGENYNRYNFEKRCAEHLANRVILPLMRRYNLPIDRVKFIDECLKDNYQDILNESTLQYNIEKSKYFDMNVLTKEIRKFKNF